MNNCSYCQSTSISVLCAVEPITYKDQDLNISIQYSVCNQCEREFISKSQILHNDIQVRNAKKVADGLLTSGEVYDARLKLGLTQEQAAIVFGGGKNAFSKYERAQVSQSVAMDKLIRVCLQHPEVYKEMLESSGIANV